MSAKRRRASQSWALPCSRQNRGTTFDSRQMFFGASTNWAIWGVWVVLILQLVSMHYVMGFVTSFCAPAGQNIAKPEDY